MSWRDNDDDEVFYEEPYDSKDEKMGNRYGNVNVDDDDEDDGDDGDVLSHHSLISDLKPLLFKEKFSDVLFLVGENKEPIYAHKVILAASSPVLASMLYENPDFKDDSKTNEDMLKIIIRDTKPDPFKLMLRCIYTDSAEVTVEVVSDAMKIATKYCVDKLHSVCAEFLEDGVNLENACQMFENGVVMMNDPTFGLSFIEENAKAVITSDGFTDLSKSRLIVLLHSSDLKIKELDLWQSVVRWAKAECKRNKNDDLKSALNGVIEHIRFPLFNVGELSTYVIPLNVLSSEQMLELYTYIACKESKDSEKKKNYPKFRFRPNREPPLHMSLNGPVVALKAV